jgi:hypothetical protein
MANDYSFPIGVWYLDTYFWYPQPCTIKKIILTPNAGGDVAYFGMYDWSDTPRATMTAATCAITDTHQVSSTGNFEAAEALAGDVWWVKGSGSTGDTGNIGKWLISVRDGDNQIHTIGNMGSTTHLTNDASGTYTWVTIIPHTIKLTTPGTEKVMAELDFGEAGLWVPNFSLHYLSTSAFVQVFLK